MQINTFETFEKAFSEYKDYYVLIGGTATSIILDVYGFKSRATKDYDLVLLDNKMNEDFYAALIRFLRNGEYVYQSLDDRSQLFRFQTNNPNYPKIIELFSRKPDFEISGIGRIVPAVFDTKLSLSAILLDLPYYEFLCENIIIVNGYSVLNNVGLIVFKAKAWLDLYKKRIKKENVTSNDVKKHLNDVTRLTATLSGNENVKLSNPIKRDMQAFLELLNESIHLIPQNDDIILTELEVIEILTKILLG